MLFMVFNNITCTGISNSICHHDLLRFGMCIFQLLSTLIAKFMGPTWGPPGSCRPHMGPMLASWTLPSGKTKASDYLYCFHLHDRNVVCVASLGVSENSLYLTRRFIPCVWPADAPQIKRGLFFSKVPSSDWWYITCQIYPQIYNLLYIL